MAASAICGDVGAQKIKSDTVSTVSPSISHEVMGPDKEYGNREAWCAVVPGVAELDMA